MRKKFKFRSEMWIYPGMTGNWHFISLPRNDGMEIKKNFSAKVRGWGSLKVGVRIGKTKWETSIFPDKRSETYILPVKALVRKHEGIFAGDKIVVTLEILI